MVIRVIAIGFSIIAIILLAFSLRAYNKTRSFLNKSVSSEGTIVKVIPRQRRARIGTTTYYHYLIKYQTANGQAIEFESSEGTSFPEYKEGDKLPVLYDPGDPKNAEINFFSFLWYGPTILAIIGGCLQGTGITLLWVMAKPAKRIRTEVKLREIRRAIRSGNLRRDSEYQPFLVAMTFIGFTLLGVALLVILLASTTTKVVLSLFLLYACIQAFIGIRKQRSKAKNSSWQKQ